MSYIGSPKIMPRVHLSPKIKQRARNPQFKKASPIKTKIVKVTKRKIRSPMRTSPMRASPMRAKITNAVPVRVKSPNRSKAFLTQKEKFKLKPTVNPVTNRNIKIGGDTYNKLVKLYGNPY